MKNEKNEKIQTKEKNIIIIIFEYIIKLIITFLFIGIFSIFIAPYLFSDELTVTKYDIKTPKELRSPIKIVFIADLHSSIFGDEQSQLIEQIEKAEPDLIVLGGDIIDDRVPMDGSLQLLDKLKNKYKMYYVTGNHEYWTKKIDTIVNKIKSYGVTTLRGESTTFSKNDDTISISGIDDPYDPYENTVFQLKRAYSQIEDMNSFKILIAHRPELLDEYLKFDYDLILSGHAHGGQWRIPWILPNGIFAPDQGFFPKYGSGNEIIKHDINNSQLTTNFIVSRGLSKKLSIPRIINKPELIIITITQEIKTKK